MWGKMYLPFVFVSFHSEYLVAFSRELLKTSEAWKREWTLRKASYAGCKQLVSLKQLQEQKECSNLFAKNELNLNQKMDITVLYIQFFIKAFTTVLKTQPGFA